MIRKITLFNAVSIRLLLITATVLTCGFSLSAEKLVKKTSKVEFRTDEEKVQGTFTREQKNGRLLVEYDDGKDMDMGVCFEDNMSIPKGAKVFVKALPDRGSKVTEILVNGEPLKLSEYPEVPDAQMGNFVADKDFTIVANFTEPEKPMQKFKLTFNKPEGINSLVIFEYPDQRPFESGATIVEGRLIGVNMYTKGSYYVEDITLNGKLIGFYEDKTFGMTYVPSMRVRGDMDFHFTAKKGTAPVYTLLYEAFAASNGILAVRDIYDRYIDTKTNHRRGTPLYICMRPDPGFKVGKLTINGKPMRFKAEGKKTEDGWIRLYHVMTSDATVEVEFIDENDVDAAEDVLSEVLPFNIQGKKIEFTTEGHAKVFTLQGETIFNKEAVAAGETIGLAEGMYIISINGKNYKCILR